MHAVTFDFGQTLAALDADLTAARLAERSLSFDPQRIGAALPDAWRVYDDAIHRGLGGHPWKIFMRALLERAASSPLDEEALTSAVDFLWSEQPRKNLWRRPIPGMLELAEDLSDAGVPVGIISNSEGRLAELVAELGWDDRFLVIADSGRLGMDKPGREIFTWTAERLGRPLDRVVHVGDSLAADVEGALGAGLRAVWFGGDPKRALGERARVAKDAGEVRRALVEFGLTAVAERVPTRASTRPGSKQRST
ncbi:HAD family hydrolase [Polyangium sorediatum]|uniref:HAD family hydrolase n=1 Tax=Polyangium sorediatum TaxID=889274 RepID=A0ABT6P3H0_9BACT|nr:HAD family hydrolase [Polyangium sorediatum]MDI1435150.1 HAD family hydrolase [Polyangium sorediatum]